MEQGKKFFTLSFDDGVTQDRRLIEILKKYHFTACTFNLNTGLFGANWEWVGKNLGDPSLTHIRMEAEEVKTLYRDYEVAVHTLHHPSLKDLSRAEVLEEINGDAENITALFGKYPIGMAWPGGDHCYTEENIRWLQQDTKIRYARATTPTHRFDFPDRFEVWKPTCSISDDMVMTLAEKFLNEKTETDRLFYVWGHSYELDFAHRWEIFEALVKMMSGSPEVTCLTNGDIYLYSMQKDRVLSSVGN